MKYSADVEKLGKTGKDAYDWKLANGGTREEALALGQFADQREFESVLGNGCLGDDQSGVDLDSDLNLGYKAGSAALLQQISNLDSGSSSAIGSTGFTREKYEVAAWRRRDDYEPEFDEGIELADPDTGYALKRSTLTGQVTIEGASIDVIRGPVSLGVEFQPDFTGIAEYELGFEVGYKDFGVAGGWSISPGGVLESKIGLSFSDVLQINFWRSLDLPAVLRNFDKATELRVVHDPDAPNGASMTTDWIERFTGGY